MKKKPFREGKPSIIPIQTPKFDNRGLSQSRDPRLSRQEHPNEIKNRARSKSASENRSEKINKISVITPSR